MENIKKEKTEQKLEIPVECYSRVAGYYRPIKQWNYGKQAEFEDRNLIKIIDIKEQLKDYNVN